MNEDWTLNALAAARATIKSAIRREKQTYGTLMRAHLDGCCPKPQITNKQLNLEYAYVMLQRTERELFADEVAAPAGP